MDFAENFEDLKIWQCSRALANGIYGAMEKSPDFGFGSQIQRAATFVMNTATEGFRRRTELAVVTGSA